MEPTRTLTEDEKQSLQRTLGKPGEVSMLLHGEGASRQLSFYAVGTRLETRIDYPDDAS